MKRPGLVNNWGGKLWKKVRGVMDGASYESAPRLGSRWVSTSDLVSALEAGTAMCQGAVKQVGVSVR